MIDTERGVFRKSLVTFLYLTSGTENPSDGLIMAYWEGLKEYEFTQVRATLERLGRERTGHVSLANMRAAVEGKKRTAFEELSDPEWMRRGFESEEAYDKANHEKWQAEEKARGK